LTLANLAELCRERGRPREAVAALREATAIYRRGQGARHPDTRACAAKLAELQQQTSKMRARSSR
jgi:hypothetical protein